MAGYVAAKTRIFAATSERPIAVIGRRRRAMPTPRRACSRPNGRLPRRADRRTAPASIRAWSASTAKLVDALEPAAPRSVVDLAERADLPGAHNCAERRRRLRRGARAGRRARGDRRGDARASRPRPPHGAVGTVDGVLFVNDSKATNADADGAGAAPAIDADLLDRRRPAEGASASTPLRALSRPHPPRLSDRRGGGRVRGVLAQHGRAAHQVGHPRPRGCGRRRGGRGRAPTPNAPSSCCRPPAPRSTSSPASSARGDAFRALVGALGDLAPDRRQRRRWSTPMTPFARTDTGCSAAGGGRSTVRCSPGSCCC